MRKQHGGYVYILSNKSAIYEFWWQRSTNLCIETATPKKHDWPFFCPQKMHILWLRFYLNPFFLHPTKNCALTLAAVVGHTTQNLDFYVHFIVTLLIIGLVAIQRNPRFEKNRAFIYFSFVNTNKKHFQIYFKHKNYFFIQPDKSLLTTNRRRKLWRPKKNLQRKLLVAARRQKSLKRSKQIQKWWQQKTKKMMLLSQRAVQGTIHSPCFTLLFYQVES